MIDIHSHIIFGVDDGPKTPEESLALLQESYRQGVRGIVATSHRRKGMFETPEEIIKERFEQVQELARIVSDDLFLFYGAEIYYTDDVAEKLERGELPCYADSKSILLEFSPSESYRRIQKAVREVLALGLTPVLAHIERYDALDKEPNRVAELIQLGAYTQVNSASILKAKWFGDPHKVYKQRAKLFLDEDLVHFVASDMHNLNRRPPYLQEAYQLIEQAYGSHRAKALFIEHPLALLQGRNIV